MIVDDGLKSGHMAQFFFATWHITYIFEKMKNNKKYFRI